jgi:transcription elongation factor GreA
MARALIGKYEGDEITLSAPGGEMQYEVIQVRYI